MIRDNFVSAALALRGLTEPSPELGAIVDLGGTPAHQLAVEHESLCMLVYRGLLVSLGLDPRIAEADRPYVNGSIPAILGRVLDAASARRVTTLVEPPQQGDALWYAAAPGFPEHIDACITEIDTDDPAGGDGPYLVLSAIAGGERWTQNDVDQGSATPEQVGHQCVKLLPRRLRWDGRAWVCQSTGRRVRWVLAADVIATHYGIGGQS